MTLFDYELMSREEQVDHLYKNGVYIGKRKAYGLVAVLYQLESFYVEVWYKKYRQYIEQINAFASVALIDAYLEQIVVEDLV